MLSPILNNVLCNLEHSNCKLMSFINFRVGSGKKATEDAEAASATALMAAAEEEEEEATSAHDAPAVIVETADGRLVDSVASAVSGAPAGGMISSVGNASAFDRVISSLATNSQSAASRVFFSAAGRMSSSSSDGVINA